MTSFFTEVCRIVGTKNVYITMYHNQCNGKVERFNSTILSAISRYVRDNHLHWDRLEDALTYEYNCRTSLAVASMDLYWRYKLVSSSNNLLLLPVAFL